MFDVTGFGICSLNSISECTILSNRLSGLFYKGLLTTVQHLRAIDLPSIDSQDLAREMVFAVCLFWVLVLFSILTKVARRHF